MKKYKVVFYTTSIGQTGAPLRDALPNPLLSGLKQPANLQSHVIDNHEFQIRDLQKVGNVWKGVFGRLRDDSPNVINAKGHEAALTLQPTDRLIEKCHFLYYANHDILAWQVNNNVAYISKFNFYLAQLLNSTVFVSAVVGTQALNKVINGTIKTIECKVATPKTPLGNVPNYSQPMFDLMNTVHGSTIKINISAGRGTLAGKIRNLITWASANPQTKTLRAKLDGDEEPIDLLADRITDSIQVPMVGHYPDPTQVFKGLDRAFTDNQAELTPFFR